MIKLSDLKDTKTRASFLEKFKGRATHLLRVQVHNAAGDFLTPIPSLNEDGSISTAANLEESVDKLLQDGDSLNLEIRDYSHKNRAFESIKL